MRAEAAAPIRNRGLDQSLGRVGFLPRSAAIQRTPITP